MNEAHCDTVLAWAFLTEASSEDIRKLVPNLESSLANYTSERGSQRARAWAEALIEAGTAILHSREIAKGARPT